MNLIGYDGQIELNEDDWADEYEADDDEDEPDDDDEDEPDDDEWGCDFGADCLMPSFHHMRSECYTVEMSEAWMEEQSND